MAVAPGPDRESGPILNDGPVSFLSDLFGRGDERTASDLHQRATKEYVQSVITLVRLVRVLLIVILALFAISFVIGIASLGTGAAEKIALLALIAGCIFAAAQISKSATRTRERLQRR